MQRWGSPCRTCFCTDLEQNPILPWSRFQHPFSKLRSFDSVTKSCDAQIFILIYETLYIIEMIQLHYVVRIAHKLGIFGLRVDDTIGDLKSTGRAHCVTAWKYRQMSIRFCLLETDVIVIRSHQARHVNLTNTITEIQYPRQKILSRILKRSTTYTFQFGYSRSAYNMLSM